MIKQKSDNAIKLEKPITVITRDNIRKLRPHLNNEAELKKNKRAILIGADELDKIRNAAKFLTPSEIQEREKLLNGHKNEQLAIAANRKLAMEKYDVMRAKNAKLSDLDRETLEKANHLLAKAQMQIEEQEDEIKHLNELMLYAKCVSIRDNQVEQKQQRKEEDLRLDAIMERERVNELAKLEEKERKRMEELRRGAAKIRQQIEERREAALLEQERKDQETKQILKTIAENAEQEKREKAAKIQAQRKLMQGVTSANQESIELKKKEKLLEEEEDRKVLQYILEKEKRDLENDRIQAQKKAEREQELARLRAAQEKMSDKQAQQDALRAQRAYEAYEREWRRKEKEAAEKQLQQEKELREERLRQQQAREKAIAIESHKLKEEFLASLQQQKEIEARIKQEEEIRAQKNRAYALEVKAQIKEKELAKQKSRDEFFLEGVKLGQERAEKKHKIELIKNRKIQVIIINTRNCAVWEFLKNTVPRLNVKFI
ncbi:Cilia- and flagella-associated protein 45 [Boothiomyces macroporosus]|uniref:Cilia- and flagella-associated protein 45 n=1 Tax=Boothiomyces macroporosus TaxID=261099 RepID=A0AAD5Y1N8_9FUNG|nr:Cilia- and flagella-associated protein 45 [Boothiomyces macroporosus]